MKTVRINVENFKPGDVFVVKQDEHTCYVKRPISNMAKNVRRKHRKEVRAKRASFTKFNKIAVDQIMADLFNL